jgi:hypothetical protein
MEMMPAIEVMALDRLICPPAPIGLIRTISTDSLIVRVQIDLQVVLNLSNPYPSTLSQLGNKDGFH